MAGPITIAILGDNRGLNNAIGQSEGRLSKFGRIAGGVGKAVAGGLLVAGAGAIMAGKAVVSSASNAQQSLGATQTVFGKYADTVVRDSNRAAQSVGLSANEYRESANLIGSLFRNQGVEADKLAGKTRDMVKTGADLAATFGGPTSAAVEALGSAFKGEFDPLEKYGISIKQSTINAELAARGQDKLTGAALNAAQQQATTRLIMEQSSRAQGAFARESNTLAGQQQRLGASFENIKAKIGGALLPVLTQAAAFVNTTVLPAFSRFVPPLLQGAKAVGAQLQPAIAGLIGVFRTVAPIVLNMARNVAANLMPAARQLAKTFKADVLPSIQRIVPPVYRFISAVAQLATKILGVVLPPIIRLAGFILRNLVPAVVSIVAGATKAIGGLQRFGAFLGTAGAKVAEFAGKVRQGIADAVSWVTGLPDRIKAAATGAASWLVKAGGDVIGGFISGLASRAGEIVSAVKNYIADKIPGPLKKFLGISSPSKVTRLIGRQTSDGLILGMRDRQAKLLAEARKHVKQLAGKYAELKKQVTASALDFGSIINAGGETPTAGTIEQGMLERVEQIKAFRANLAELEKRGLSKALIRQLAAAGVEQGGAQAAALTAGTNEQIRSINQLQGQLVRAAGQLGTTAGKTVYGEQLREARRQLKELTRRLQIDRRELAQIGKRRITVKLTAAEVSALMRGKQIRMDLDEYEKAGGKRGGSGKKD